MRPAATTPTAPRHARHLPSLIVAHGEAEEEKVYPTLRTKGAIGEHEKEHGEEEHAEINEALVAFLEAKGTDTEKYDNALEEPRHRPQPPRQRGGADDRQPGARGRRGGRARRAWASPGPPGATSLLEQGCASLEQVQALVRRAEKEGVLASPKAREEADAIKEDAKEEAKEVEEASKEKARD